MPEFTAKLLSVPTEVIFVCAAVNIVPVRLPVTLPVTLPVSAPTKVVAVAVPSTSKSPLKSTLPDALKVLASISPLELILPITSNRCPGEVVPIPNLVLITPLVAKILLEKI